MADHRRRRYASAVWVPLRASEQIVAEGQYPEPGWKEEFFVMNTTAFPAGKRREAEKLDWHDFTHSPGPYAYRDGRYKPCEVYQANDYEDMGIDFVFEQHVGNGHPRIWHLSQDLVMALRLLQEGDQWVRPDEDYAVIVRQRRDHDGSVVAIEIRSDCLRDYLAARGLALRLYYFRSRTAIDTDPSHLPWPPEGISEENSPNRFEARVWEIDRSGGRYGDGIGVFTVWRTDVDPEEDVPIFGPEDASNTESSSREFVRKGIKNFRAVGEMWQAEWIDPADRSERVRGDSPAEQSSFIVDASGERWSSSRLDHENIGRYLWFDPRIVSSLLQRRAGGLLWYSRDTGEIWSLPDYKIHFGINRAGLLTVYAYDVARLPMWQQRTWAAFNVPPDGAVSVELLDAQMRTRPASTIAPEAAIPELVDRLDELFREWIGAALFKPHDATVVIMKNVHRFRALDQSGLLALAKDLARLTADRIDIGALRAIAPAPKDEKWGSLKSLEKALATILPADQSRSLMTPLVGVYELRLGDAHLPSGEIEDAFAMIGVDRSQPTIFQGLELLARTANALIMIGRAVSKALPGTSGGAEAEG